MYRSLYFKPNTNYEPYDVYVRKFVKQFQLNEVKHDCDTKYIFENNYMLMKIDPQIAEILIYDETHKDFISELTDFFNN